MFLKIVFFLILGSSSFESQKMERPSISVISPTSPGALKDAPQVLPGQLSVCIYCTSWRPLVFSHCCIFKNVWLSSFLLLFFFCTCVDTCFHFS